MQTTGFLHLRRRSASAVNSADAPDHLLNTQPLAILPNPPLVGECRSAIVICHFYSVGKHSSAWCSTSSHEPARICQESVRETPLFWLLPTTKSPSTQRWDTAGGTPPVGKHSSGRVQAGSHEPARICQESVRETPLFWLLPTTKSPSTQRWDTAGGTPPVGKHSSGRVQAGSHEPTRICQESVRKTPLFWLLPTTKSPSTQRRDAAARRKTFISVVLHKFSRTDTNMSRKRPSNTAIMAVNNCKKPNTSSAVTHRDAAGDYKGGN